MDELRYSRLENRVDEIKDDVSDIKANQTIMSHNMVQLTQAVKEHVAGDDKIITEITPIIEEFKYQQERRKRRHASIREWGMKLRIPATILGIVATLIGIMASL